MAPLKKVGKMEVLGIFQDLVVPITLTNLLIELKKKFPGMSSGRKHVQDILAQCLADHELTFEKNYYYSYETVAKCLTERSKAKLCTNTVKKSEGPVVCSDGLHATNQAASCSENSAYDEINAYIGLFDANRTANTANTADDTNFFFGPSASINFNKMTLENLPAVRETGETEIVHHAGDASAKRTISGDPLFLATNAVGIMIEGDGDKNHTTSGEPGEECEIEIESSGDISYTTGGETIFMETDEGEIMIESNGYGNHTTGGEPGDKCKIKIELNEDVSHTTDGETIFMETDEGEIMIESDGCGNHTAYGEPGDECEIKIDGDADLNHTTGSESGGEAGGESGGEPGGESGGEPGDECEIMIEGDGNHTTGE